MNTASDSSLVFRVGAVRVHHVEEWQGTFPIPPSAFFQGYDEAAFRELAPPLTPDYYRADADYLYAFLQSWILEVDGLKVLYDTGAGNAKTRPGIPLFGGLDTPFLTRMAAAGFRPEDLDLVICSHLHIDHVGWNTQMRAGRWVPTFPNARYLFSAIDRDYWDPQGSGSRPTPGGVYVNTNVFEDSVQPLLDANVAELVSVGHRVSESITLQLGPGHTPGHLVMDVRSQGDSALFVGDILHHPAQVHYPEWNSPFCEDQALARITRRRVLADAADRGPLLFPAHFGGAHCCRVRRRSQSFEAIFEVNS